MLIHALAVRAGMQDQAGSGPDCGTTVWHIGQHNRHRADAAVIPYFHATQYLRISAQFDVIAHHRHGTVDMPIADCYALAQGAIGANLCVRMHENTAEMPYSQARPNAGGFWQADAGNRFNEAKCKPIQRGPPFFSETGGALVETAPLTIKPHRPQRLFPEKRTPRPVAGQIAFPVAHMPPCILHLNIITLMHCIELSFLELLAQAKWSGAFVARRHLQV